MSSTINVSEVEFEDVIIYSKNKGYWESKVELNGWTLTRREHHDTSTPGIQCSCTVTIQKGDAKKVVRSGIYRNGYNEYFDNEEYCVNDIEILKAEDTRALIALRIGFKGPQINVVYEVTIA